MLRKKGKKGRPVTTADAKQKKKIAETKHDSSQYIIIVERAFFFFVRANVLGFRGIIRELQTYTYPSA